MPAALIAIGTIALVVVLLVLGGAVLFALSFLGVWIQARASGVEVTYLHLLGMRLRRLDPRFIVEDCAVTLHKAGQRVPIDALEAHALSGGSLESVVAATIAADKAGLGISFAKLCAIDLAGRDVLGAVEAVVNPRVLTCPPSASPPLQAVAKDGIRVQVRLRVTLRTNLDRLIGGANQDTVMARVGQGIVAAIGHSESHKQVLEFPEMISQYILDRGLDSGTSFEIVSVDIMDVDVLDNVGARLMEEQAVTDQQVAQARAEMRRAMAFAQTQEMHAEVRAMEAQLTANRANIPLALAGACRAGHLWLQPRPVRGVFGDNRWDVAAG